MSTKGGTVDSDDLPFTLFSPASNGKVTWKCGYDEDGKIISVFQYNDIDTGDKDRNITVLPSLTVAREVRRELVKGDWLPLKEHRTTFTTPDGEQFDSILKYTARMAEQANIPRKDKKLMKRMALEADKK